MSVTCRISRIVLFFLMEVSIVELGVQWRAWVVFTLK